MKRRLLKNGYTQKRINSLYHRQVGLVYPVSNSDGWRGFLKKEIMTVLHIQPEHQAVTIYYDVNKVLMFVEVSLEEFAKYIGVYDANLETVELYAEQYLSDIKKHEHYENVQDIIDMQPDIAHKFKPYTVVEGNFKKLKKVA